MVVRVEVSPDLLLWAVERAGWDEHTVENRAPNLDKWLAGTQAPTLKLCQSQTRERSGMSAVPKPSANVLDTIYMCQTRQDWYRSHAQEHGIDAPAFVGSATTQTPPNFVARQIRDLLDFDFAERSKFSSWEDALRNLIDCIERIGVLVMINGIVGSNTHRKLNPQEFRGFALTDPLVPLIFVNGADTKAAQIFTLILELAHVWLGTSALSDAAMAAEVGVEDELWCNHVAAEVLPPCHAAR